jgi:RHS repeat-associated protein
VILTDQVNRKIKRESDGLGRLIKVTEQTSAGALTQETSYTYSLLNKLTLVNQGNQGRAYKYDAIGRLLYEKIPEQTATISDGTGTYWTSAYAYTEYSALKKRTDARGVESHYAYNALHRATGIWYTGVGGDDAGYVRPAVPSGVAATGSCLFEYTSWGALSSVTVQDLYSETYAFDGYARPTSVTRWILGQVYSGSKTYTTSYEYNQGSQLTKMIYPSGQQVEVNHDDKGRVQSLSGGLYGINYNIAGQVTGSTLGNGVVESYGYNANRLQLTSQTATKSGNQLMNLTYNYQATAGQMGTGSTAGNAGQLMSISGTINSTTESAAYTYDLLGRLVTSDQSSNGSSAQRLFEYDRWGNRTAVYNGLPGGKTPPTQIQSVTFPPTFQQGGPAPTNRIGAVTNNGSPMNYTYDVVGNVTNDGVHSYTYDAENRVVSVDSGATAQYRYDHQNRRVCKIIGSSWTHYVWEGSQVIGEHDATTPVSGYGQPPYQEQSARTDYTYAGARMIRSRQRTSSTGSWTTRYYLSDRLSVRMTLDTSGNVLGRQAHLPFGDDFGESGTQEKHHFTNYERDGESGSDYATNRTYSPNTGRFQQADPYRASGYMMDPQSWNRYGYSRNNPVDFMDTVGLLIEEVMNAFAHTWVMNVSAGSSWITAGSAEFAFAIGWNIGGGASSAAAGNTVGNLVPVGTEPSPDFAPCPKLPADVPSGNPLDKNVDLAKFVKMLADGGPLPLIPPVPDFVAKAGRIGFFAYMVRPGGEWDYKKGGNDKYEDFGNFNFGAVGAALGIDKATLLKGAGWAQTYLSQNPGDGNSMDFVKGLIEVLTGIGASQPPYGDQKTDQAWIKKGMRYYEAKYVNHDKNCS